MVIKLKLKNWKQINWSNIEQSVKSYRSEIFLAAKSGNIQRVQYLQRRALSSKSILLWSIRRITSINQGKQTPGLDKHTYLSHEKKWALFKLIAKRGIFSFKPLPVKRIYIPKSNGKTRPLGIPIIIDRVIQTITVIALEPQWEAKFEHGSYGFRPARSCHDAMIRIYKTLNKKKKTFVLEGDIKGCFDNISHEALLERILGFPGYNLIAQWLKAGYWEKGVFHESYIGTPQGGSISPLLSNIALHGMEEALGIKYHQRGYIKTGCPYTLVRYADDFVVLTHSREQAHKAKEILTTYLRKMGLVLSPEKTHITDARDGFDFLGWNFRIFPDKRRKSNEITLVHPSLNSIQKVKTELKLIWRSFVGNSIGNKIRKLNEVIIGWANYHRFVDSNRTFRSLDHFNFLQSSRFMHRQHPSKTWKWMVAKYYKTVGYNNWVFHDQTLGLTLTKFSSYKIVTFLPVKYGMLPDDPDCSSYFAQRKKDRLLYKFSTSKSMYQMLESQCCLCPVCGESLAPEIDVHTPLHVHHLIPKSQGGPNHYSNLMVLHDECHRWAHSTKLSRNELISRLTESISKSTPTKENLSKIKWGSSRYPSYSLSASLTEQRKSESVQISTGTSV